MYGNIFVAVKKFTLNINLIFQPIGAITKIIKAQETAPIYLIFKNFSRCIKFYMSHYLGLMIIFLKTLERK